MKIKCIIIEDEPPAQAKLAAFINEVEFLDLKAEFASAINVYQYLQENNIDLIFLDIQLGLLNGLDFLASLPISPKIIITTAYADHAIKSYEYEVIDYLLKPFSFDRFHLAVTKVYNLLTERNDKLNSYIFVRTEHRIEKIEIPSILYIEGMKDYLKIVTSDKYVMTLLSFVKIAEVLPANNFFRVHHSFIISIDKILNIEKDRIKIGDRTIPLSQSKRGAFYKHIGKDLI